MQEPERRRMSPAWLASLLAAVAIIGAASVYLLATATHRADDLAIADYGTATEPWLAIADEAERSLAEGNPYDAGRLEEAHAAILVLSAPRILEPLRERELAWLAQLVEANRILLDQGETSAFASAFEEAVALRADADAERDEIHCNADPAACG